MRFSDPPMPRVLVYLANGVQGGAVVRAALARGFAVRAMVRRRAHTVWSSVSGVETVEADLDDLDALRAASVGVDAVVLQIPTGPSDIMAAQARRAAQATVAAGVGAVVLKLASVSRPAPCAEPSFVGNARVEAALRDAGLSFACVRPTMYLDNLLKPSARRDIVEDGVFSPPIAATQRIAWTSADDCARAAVALLGSGATGDYRIGGARDLDGPALAACLSEGLGRPVVYRAQPVDAFEQEVEAAMGAGMGARIASKFRYFASFPDEADAILTQSGPSPFPLADLERTDVTAWVRRHRAAFLED